MKNAVATGLLMALTLTGAMAQQNSTMSGGSTTMVGKMSGTDFMRKNKEGAATVSAIKPNSNALSTADKNLMMEVAKGGMMQLETSRLAVQKASNSEVRELAQAEVEEQTGLSAKLKEIASAKGITLPETPDEEINQMLLTMQGLAKGRDFDAHYVREHGVAGHEKLDRVMSMVKSDASDANLKAVAKAAHPLVKTHLQVSRQLLDKLGNGSPNPTSGGK
jgi:putative membrane protein